MRKIMLCILSIMLILPGAACSGFPSIEAESKKGPGIDRPFDSPEEREAALQKFLQDTAREHEVVYVEARLSGLKDGESGWADPYEVTTYANPLFRAGDSDDGWVHSETQLKTSFNYLLIERHGDEYHATVFQENCATILWHHTPGIRPPLYDDYIKMEYEVVNMGLCF